MNTMKCAILIFLVVLFIAPQSMATNSAVFIMYHRFGENNYPSTNVRLAQLENHIRELKSGPYTVLPVLQILSDIENGRALPKRTVGITIDDGFESVYTKAWPRFRKAQLPFTVFISTNSIDENRSNRLNWNQIREMRAAGVTFGAHTASHLHMVKAPRDRNKLEIIKSNTRMTAELGEQPVIFAYPYGEASNEVFELISESGYKYAFGQHSGVISRSSDRKYLPRFALNEQYGALNRFKLIINTLPLSISEFTPGSPIIGKINPPNVGFTVMPSLKNLNRISCFTSGEGKVATTLLGTSRVEVRMTKPFIKGRNRLNCTVPGRGGRWHWLGAIFVVPKF